jgi:hypothetical protein
MPTCPRGHPTTTTDYCDVCGTPVDGSGAPTTVPAEPAAEVAAGVAARVATADAACPLCGAPRTGRFCERDGYDFLTAALSPEAAGAAVEGDPAAEVPAAAADAGGAGFILAGAERAYFDTVVAAGGPDAGLLQFPPQCPPRRFPLRGDRLLVGRRSRSRGIQPDIDLSAPPEDPGVSHSHALLLPQADGRWAVLDLGSANGTYVNSSGKPIPVHVPVPLGDGDRVFLGAWTVLTVHTAPPDAAILDDQDAESTP